MRANVKPGFRHCCKLCIAGLALSLVMCGARAGQREDLLHAPDRIEWDAGGLYDGRFDDGTPFQLQLRYPRPQTIPARVQAIADSYWYPRHFTGQRIVLPEQDAASGTIRLLRREPPGTIVESMTITLTPDRLGGSGTWTSSPSGKPRSFTLHRTLLYREVAVTRASPGSPEPFVFSAIAPVLDDAEVDGWMRHTLAACASGMTECQNRVMVDWASPSLLSLTAAIYTYMAPGEHGETASRTLHFRVKDGKRIPVGLNAFIEPGAECRATVSARLVDALRAQHMEWAERGALDKRSAPKFLALPDGLEFHFDPYEVGSYARGMPSVFLPRDQLGQ